MKQVKIKSINLINWRAQSRLVEFTDNTEVRGYNESGKSTIFNAFLWLLTGADDVNRNNYQLFDNTIEPTKENSQPASVEAILLIDGNEYKFKRTATMGWTRKRGSLVYERKGSDDYTFSIDDIERSATDYKKFIEEVLAPTEKLKIMLNVGYFLSLDWKECRKHLSDMVGEINSDEYSGDYGEIKDDLDKYTIEDLKARYRSLLKAQKQSMDSLPKTIETLKANLPDVTKVKDAEKAIEEAKKQIAKIDEKLMSGTDKEAEKKVGEMQNQLIQLNNQYIEKQDAYNKEQREKLRLLEDERTDLIIENNKIDKRNKKRGTDLSNAIAARQTLAKTLESIRAKQAELKEQLAETKAMEFNGEVCPYCGQELPVEKLEEEKAKFNSNKASKCEAILQEGRNNKAKIEILNRQIEEAEGQINICREKEPLKDLTDIDKNISDFKASFVSFDATIEAKEMLAKKADILSKIEALSGTSNSDNSNLSKMKESLLKDIEENSKLLGLGDTRIAQEERIEELQKELKSVGIEAAKIEGKLFKLSEYEREKAFLVSEKVNNNFDYVKIEMLEQNKSGEYVDTCKILDKKGVSCTVTNAASRILSGIDIALAFQKFYNLSLPLFVDNCECINKRNFPKIEGQVVKLFVDECELKIDNL